MSLRLPHERRGYKPNPSLSSTLRAMSTVRAQIDDLSDEIERVVTRLRTLGPARLTARHPGGGTVAAGAHQLAQLLADATVRLEGEPPRVVPRLGDHAVADQVSVTGRDLLTALEDARAVSEVAAASLAAGAAGSRDERVSELLAAVASFRRSL